MSNLAPEVSAEDLQYIFSTVGALRRCAIHLNAQGKSNGTATVTFLTKKDAEKAVADLDEAEVDGRIMRVQWVGGAAHDTDAEPSDAP